MANRNEEREVEVAAQLRAGTRSHRSSNYAIVITQP